MRKGARPERRPLSALPSARRPVRASGFPRRPAQRRQEASIPVPIPRLPAPRLLLTVGHSKRTGLEKALHQVEQAVRRSGSAVPGIEAAKVVSELKALLGPGTDGSTPRLD